METLIFYNDTARSLDTIAVSELDLGHVAPRSSDDSRLRLFNASNTYQALAVVISTDDPQLLLSYDGDVYGNSLTLGDIPPNATSGVFWLRRVTPSTATAGPHSGSVSATPAGWSAPIDTSTSDNVPLPTGDE